MSDASEPQGPDFTQGVPASQIPEGGMLAGRVGDAEVLIARRGGEWFAVGARCTHYRGRLAEGLLVDDTVRCPLHHACFSLRTGEALRAPALDPIACWRVEPEGDRVFVREKLPARPPAPLSPVNREPPASIVIVGGGAAGLAAADMLRRHHYDGPITMLSADVDPPVDRPNLSKDYLAGDAQDDWMPLWPSDWYGERRVDLQLRSRVTAIDPVARTVSLRDGTQWEYGALLIATGAVPVQPPIHGADGPQVFYLRSYSDARAIVERTKAAAHAVVVGASFIGLEVAASLRSRGIDVDIVAPGQVPLERVMGREMGAFVQSLHEARGVRFHLGQTMTSIDGRVVSLSGGTMLDADFVVVGAGVTPATALAESAGLAVDNGITVNEYLETSAPGVFAAGDVARWPDPHTGERLRIEHFVVAERQGQTAARNMLGHRERFDAVPFFWSQHYDVVIRYVGYAKDWDRVQIDGSFDDRNVQVTYTRQGRRLAVATVSRDRDCLVAETELERA